MVDALAKDVRELEDRMNALDIAIESLLLHGPHDHNDAIKGLPFKET